MEELLEKVISDISEKHLTQEKLLFFLFEQKVKNYGIKLTKNQKKQLALYIKENGFEGVSIETNRQQKAQLKKLGYGDLTLEFVQSDFDELEANVNEIISVGAKEATDWITSKLVKAWKTQAKSILKKIKANQKNFVKFHDQIWGKPVDLLETLISISLEAGSNFNEEFKPTAVEENNVVFDALTRLHARGCQIGSEIVVLLRNGFADGAHARWRTLHEISVIAQFIGSHDNGLAERYLAHSVVADYKRALEYRKYSNDSSYIPMSDEVFNSLETEYNEVIAKYGENFKGDYGWAYEILKNDRPKFRPTFADIEDKDGVAHMRPFVKLAHLNIHAGSKGAIFRLGLPPGDSNLLVAGPSIYGAGEPGQNTAYSMFLLTSILLRIKVDLDNLSFVFALRKLMDDVVWEFDRAMAEQESDQ